MEFFIFPYLFNSFLFFLGVLGFDNLSSFFFFGLNFITDILEWCIYQSCKLIYYVLKFQLGSGILFLKNKIFFLPFFSILIYSIVLMLIVTLIIASITLLERKLLSLVQRRVGPNFVGYKGRLQYLADALKLFLKGVAIPSGANSFFFVAMPSLAGAVCYTF